MSITKEQMKVMLDEGLKSIRNDISELKSASNQNHASLEASITHAKTEMTETVREIKTDLVSVEARLEFAENRVSHLEKELV